MVLEEGSGFDEQPVLFRGAAGFALVPAVSAAVGEPGADHVRTCGEEDREVWAVRSLVHLPDGVAVEAVQHLQDERGGDVAVADDDLAAQHGRPDLLVEVLVAVGGDKVRHCPASEGVGALAGDCAQRRVSRLACHADCEP